MSRKLTADDSLLPMYPMTDVYGTQPPPNIAVD